MSMVIQHNLNAINAHNKLGINVAGTKKATEKLSSGFRINRAADDAAGLAISEKMRAQLRGLGQAIRNANDGISLIQTAEGALDETHSMLKRLKELSVQMANGTYTDEERAYAQEEIENLKTEIDRISIATDFNGIKLLDGSLSGMGVAGTFGPKFAAIDARPDAGVMAGTVVTSSIDNVTVRFAAAPGSGGATAVWDDVAKELTLRLENGKSYSQADIDKLIAEATTQETGQTAIPAITVKLGNGVIIGGTLAAYTTEAGVAASATGTLTPFLAGGDKGSMSVADRITITSNNFGADGRSFFINTQGTTEGVTKTAETNPNVLNGTVTINLIAGKEYSNKDIENLLSKAGLDYSVELFSSVNPGGDVKFKASAYANAQVAGFGNSVAPLVADPADPNFAQWTALDTAITALTNMTGGGSNALDSVTNTGDPLNTALRGLAAGTAAVTTFINTTYTGAGFTNAANIDRSSTVDQLIAALTAERDAITVNLIPDPLFTPSFASASDIAALGTAIDDFAGSLATSVLEVARAALPGANGAAIDLIIADLNTGIGVLNTALGVFNTAAGWPQFHDIDLIPTDGSISNEQLAERIEALQVLADSYLSMASSTKEGKGVGANRVLEGGEGITFQIGANNAVEQRVTLNIRNMGANAIGVAGIDVSTIKSSQEAMDAVEKAIVNVSAQRASLGAMQNRLEHTVNSLTTTHENLTAAESQIRDADMAKEMVEYTKFNILQQAAQAMLAQANQAPQAILQLLR